MTFRLRPEAEADIEAICACIAEDNPSAAIRWLHDVYDRCRRIGRMPGIGAARPEVRPGLRMMPIGAYLILYEATLGGADIVRVVHGARLWEDLLRH